MPSSMIATLRSARLAIAPLVADDLGHYLSLYTDADTMAWIGAPLSRAAAERSFAAALSGNARVPSRRRTWTLTDTVTGARVGLLALMRDVPDLAADAAEVGAIIAPPQQARGYAAEAIAALASHAFDDLGLRRVVTRHSAANALALGLMRKLGFERLADGDGLQPCRWQLAARLTSQGTLWA